MSHLNRNRLAALFQVEPIHPWKICGKTRFEAIRVVFWSLLCYKDLKLTTKLFTGRTLHGLLIQMAKLFACKVQACTGSKMFGFKKWHSSLDFYFLLSLLPTFFTFLTSFCFSFAGDLVGFILVGKVFAKPCRIFNRIRGKERLVGSGKRFSWKFSGQCFMVFCLFLWCPWLNHAHCGMVWKVSSLYTSL